MGEGEPSGDLADWVWAEVTGLTWVWTMTRMTLQYFFMAAKSFWSCFLPSASRHRLQALVKAFFLLLCLSHAQRVLKGAGWVGPWAPAHLPPTKHGS